MIPTVEQLKALRAQGHNLVPVWRERLADTETPVSAYLKLVEGDTPDYAFLLESVSGGERTTRWSFLGRDPWMVFRSRGQNWEVTGHYAEKGSNDPVGALRRVFRKLSPATVPGIPALAGAVGFISYDAIRLVEDIPDTGSRELEMDDLCYGFYRDGVIFDNRRHRILVWAFAVLNDGTSEEQALADAQARITALETRLDQPLRKSTLDVAREPGELSSNFTEESYKAAVERCKEYIRAGDAFQIVLSQRLKVDPGCTALDIYRMLRGINPSPYMFYLKIGEVEVSGSSPETLVEVQDGKVTSRPIAGTRPRGRTPEEDQALEKELLADPKELAEHLMLIDLGRNDIGRVCEYGSVHPEDLFVIERYSHVMHIVSSVSGKIAEGHDALDVLMACFPAGTLSGSPKIRAMEIIDELEPSRRGLYGGVVCYFDLNGNAQSCIVIRTVVVKDGKAYVQAGAGIVYDSVPEMEYRETLHKASAVIQAIRAAHRAQGDLGAIDVSIAGERA